MRRWTRLDNRSHGVILLHYFTQCSRLQSSMPFKRDLALQNISLLKQPFKRQPRIENEDVTWSLQYNLHATRTNKRRTFVTTRSRVRWFILKFSHCTKNMYHIIHTQINMSSFFPISIFLDRRLRFEPTLQLKGWNLKALQNETHMRASILNVGSSHPLRKVILAFYPLRECSESTWSPR